MAEPAALDIFIARWQGVTASELATAQSFVIDLCRLLDVEVPHATAEQDYMFERPITFRHGDGGASAGRIDCYRRGAFVLEAKKLKVSRSDTPGGTPSKGFDDALLRTRLVDSLLQTLNPVDESVTAAWLALPGAGSTIWTPAVSRPFPASRFLKRCVAASNNEVLVSPGG